LKEFHVLRHSREKLSKLDAIGGGSSNIGKLEYFISS
jgi:hypothetical protein